MICQKMMVLFPAYAAFANDFSIFLLTFTALICSKGVQIFTWRPKGLIGNFVKIENGPAAVIGDICCIMPLFS